MKKIKHLYLSIFIVALLTYLLSAEYANINANALLWSLRQNTVFLAGLLAWFGMSFTIILSIRHPLLSRWCGGLDKAYKLHKWCAISSVVFALIHWLAEKVPHWLVDAGVAAHPGELGHIVMTSWQESLLEFGLILAEYGLYILIALSLVSVTKKIPYHIFYYLHKAFPVVYIACAYHVMTSLFKTEWWQTPAAYLLALVTLVAVGCALISLFQRTGRRHSAQGEILQVVAAPQDIVEVKLRNPANIAMLPGQFAFVQFEHSTERHPFTLSDINPQQQSLTLSIKKLGDYTRQLAHHLQPGQRVNMEGPYGNFTFKATSHQQLWVAGGIGITPFMAKLKDAARRGEKLSGVELWYFTRVESGISYPDYLPALCQQTEVVLHYFTANAIQTLEQRVSTIKDDLHSAALDIWFCGPEGLKKSLIQAVNQHEINLKDFHADCFSWR
ncbi:ferric reductase-like transmembrane domain-containing protein [Pantoea sp. GM01]|uniref:ferredoxin reductase family protein n=1 Tax=Pantoea sp. GM01 TaxID=1144320 RepID=UPI00027125A0|nr:ferric reductase-like transmembrane domain-containing protein [Pantoea sp. GM01]EJL86895.1 putative ferric reductase [Pantoea sp. GM01]